MADAPEFPQEGPAIRYLVQQCSKIEEQYACNSGYHKDHKAIKQRLDNLDEIISGLKKAVISIQSYQQKAEDNLSVVEDLNSHLDSTMEKALQEVLNQFKGEQNIRLDELRRATRDANNTLRNYNQNAVEISNLYHKINKQFEEDLEKKSIQIIAGAWKKTWIGDLIISIGCCVFTLLLGLVLGWVIFS